MRGAAQIAATAMEIPLGCWFIARGRRKAGNGAILGSRDSPLRRAGGAPTKPRHGGQAVRGRPKRRVSRFSPTRMGESVPRRAGPDPRARRRECRAACSPRMGKPVRTRSRDRPVFGCPLFTATIDKRAVRVPTPANHAMMTEWEGRTGRGHGTTLGRKPLGAGTSRNTPWSDSPAGRPDVRRLLVFQRGYWDGRVGLASTPLTWAGIDNGRHATHKSGRGRLGACQWLCSRCFWQSPDRDVLNAIVNCRRANALRGLLITGPAAGETHFHVFGSLALLPGERDWRCW